jgi:hypothetical protein
MFEPVETIANIELALVSLSFGTISGTDEFTPGRNTAPHKLSRIPVRKTIQTAIKPLNAAIDNITMLIPLSMSIIINNSFLLYLSISTPAKGDANTPGSVDDAMSVPISAVDPVAESTQNPRAIL